MGGFGSGRPSRYGRPTCEACHNLDLAWLRRRGMLKPGSRSTVTWSRGGEVTGSISLTAQVDGVRLLYGITRDGEHVTVDELVRFAYTSTKFDGRRRWLRCPRCSRGCRKLYGGRYFRCRRCHGLAYASQSEQAEQRAISRANKIAKRLHDMWGGVTEREYEFPPKPPRMRWATYQRLEATYDHLQNRWAIGVMTRFGIGF